MDSRIDGFGMYKACPDKSLPADTTEAVDALTKSLRVRSNMKRIIPKHLVAASAALLFAACATPHSEWKPAGYYITNQSVYGCDSFEGKKGTAVKQTALLSFSLQRRLLGLLDHAASADKDLQKELEEFREQLVCWYETPEKDVELVLGALCDSPFKIIFHPQGGEWTIAAASRAIVTCSTARR